MTVDISPQNVLIFLNLGLFVGQWALIYFYLTVAKKKADAVITTNEALISSVTDLVNTLTKMLQRTTIEQAIAEAKAKDDREFIID